METEFRMI